MFSDIAIATCLMLRKVYGLQLRQTEEFVMSIFAMMKIKCPVPDYSTLSRGGKRLIFIYLFRGQCLQ